MENLQSLVKNNSNQHFTNVFQKTNKSTQKSSLGCKRISIEYPSFRPEVVSMPTNYLLFQINKKSQVLKRGTKDLFMWQESKINKMNFIRQLYQQQESEELQLTKSVAIVDDISNQLAQYRRPKEKVEDILIEKGLQTKEKIKQLGEFLYGSLGRPQITLKSQKLNRSQDVFTRLSSISPPQTNIREHIQSKPLNYKNPIEKQSRITVLSQQPEITPAIQNIIARIQKQQETVRQQMKQHAHLKETQKIKVNSEILKVQGYGHSERLCESLVRQSIERNNSQVYLTKYKSNITNITDESKRTHPTYQSHNEIIHEFQNKLYKRILQ